MLVDFILGTDALLESRKTGYSDTDHFSQTYLKQPNKQCCNTNGSHNSCVVIQQGLSAPLHPDIELLCQKVIVVVSTVVCQLVLDTGSWGAWVAAAEGHSIHQKLPIDIAL